jgi:ribosomal protein S12 methylthiotransferase accessory factor YcaO
MSSQKTTNFSNIMTYQNEDILEDINLIIKFFKEVGLKKAIIVNLTNPKIKIPVVRAIVPGLETFKITKSVMGFRARSSYK